MERYSVLEELFAEVATSLEHLQAHFEARELRAQAQQSSASALAQALHVLALATNRNRIGTPTVLDSYASIHALVATWSEDLTKHPPVRAALDRLDRLTALERGLIESKDYAAVRRVLKEIQALRWGSSLA